MGSKKRPFYRVIATDSRMPRDGRFIETLGYYNPVAQPAVVHLDEATIFKWFERGAVPTTSAASLLRREGFLQKWELMKQGFTGAELDNRVEAIRNQRTNAVERREKQKQGAKSLKAKAKEEASKEAEKAPAEAPAEAESAEPSGEPEAPATE